MLQHDTAVRWPEPNAIALLERGRYCSFLCLLPRGDQHGAQALAAGIVSVEHFRQRGVALHARAFGWWLELRGEIGAFAPARRNEAAPERLLLARKAQEPAGYVLAPHRLGEACRLERRLGHARPDMRARHKGSVAHERDAPEHRARAFQIEDRLEERLRAREDFRELWGNQRPRRRLDDGDDVGANERRGNGGAVIFPTRIGAEINERLVGIGRAVPDDIVGAPADLRLVVAPGHGIGEEELAFRQTERVTLEDLRPDGGRHGALVQHGAPSQVARILRREVREKLLAHGGAPAIGANEQLAFDLLAVGEHRGDHARVLLYPDKGHAEPIACGRERVAQRAVEPAPRAHQAGGVLLDQHTPARIKEDDAIELDAHGCVEVDPDALEDIEQLRVGAEPRTAAGEVFRVALEHADVPAFTAQQVRRKEAAERAAYHQRASGGCAHAVLLHTEPFIGRRIPSPSHWTFVQKSTMNTLDQRGCRPVGPRRFYSSTSQLRAEDQYGCRRR